MNYWAIGHTFGVGRRNGAIEQWRGKAKCQGDWNITTFWRGEAKSQGDWIKKRHMAWEGEESRRLDKKKDKDERERARRKVCNLGLWFPDIRKDDVPREVP